MWNYTHTSKYILSFFPFYSPFFLNIFTFLSFGFPPLSGLHYRHSACVTFVAVIFMFVRTFVLPLCLITYVYIIILVSMLLPSIPLQRFHSVNNNFCFDPFFFVCVNFSQELKFVLVFFFQFEVLVFFF